MESDEELFIFRDARSNQQPRRRASAGRKIFMDVELVRYPHSLAPVDLL
jgi:hypothetical protein